ncbi:DUF2809 domain-containing protein [uncultured Clostridium sp.]|uniref:ribosomal maturation YjgA family protein n=1 Tax=uncultured Clostridium sp. TaxID=59620 RepID=UPI0025E0B37E|nr:DUF2809 domain-containing protein [uncultured Clostridium sp.]
MKRNRITYFMCIIMAIILTIMIENYKNVLPLSIGNYLENVLKALIIYLFIAFIFKKISAINISVISMLICSCFSISNLCEIPWVDNIKNTSIGLFILGNSFVYTDLICYLVGVILGFVLEMLLLVSKK